MWFRRVTSRLAVRGKFSRKTPCTGNLWWGFRWEEETVRSRSRTHLFFFARRWPARSTDKSSAPIMAQASGIAYEDWPRPLPSHADARLLRLRAPVGLYARGRSSGRLFQP